MYSPCFATFPIDNTKLQCYDTSIKSNVLILYLLLLCSYTSTFEKKSLVLSQCKSATQDAPLGIRDSSGARTQDPLSVRQMCQAGMHTMKPCTHTVVICSLSSLCAVIRSCITCKMGLYRQHLSKSYMTPGLCRHLQPGLNLSVSSPNLSLKHIPLAEPPPPTPPPPPPASRWLQWNSFANR